MAQPYFIEQLALACPALVGCHENVICAGQACMFFATENETRRAYSSTVGEDGPTKTNSYDGPARVFALLCDDRGNLLSENT